MAEIKSRIQLKHDTEAHWQLATGFTPKAGEIIIYDADANNPVRYKIGDGTTNVNTLPFATGTAVLYTQQNINEDQQKQALINLGLSTEDIEGLKVIEAVTADKVAKKLTVGSKTYDGSADVSIAAADLGLEQAMKFLGTTTTDISDASDIDTIIIGSGTVKVEAGNVVLYDGYEYVWTGSAWEQLGQEGSFALKSITISAGNGLEGGGDLSENRTISAKAGTGITVNSSGIHNAGVRAITQDGTDGHKLTINTGGTNATITIPDNDTTYNEATTSAAGLMSAADKTFVDGVQAQIDGKMNATNPTGSGSFSFGRKADTTVGGNSVAIGYNVTASDFYSYAEGQLTIASGLVSHAEGWCTEASGDYSHAEGFDTHATGYNSHAEGDFTTASGNYSHTEGYNITASGNYQHVQGKYNISDTTSAHIVGNGESSTARSNAHTLDFDGNAWFAGDVYVGSTSGTNKDDGSRVLTSVSIVRW